MKWNWPAIWWYFVTSWCGALIAVYAMAPYVFDELSKTNNLEMKARIAEARTQFAFTTTVGTYVALLSLLISQYVIFKLYGPVWKKVPPKH